MRRLSVIIVAALALSGASPAHAAQRHAAPAPVVLLNASYDPTRELFRDINTAFAREWQARTGQRVTINQSHGGSGKQARSVSDGLRADVVTLALAQDIDLVARAGLIAPDWASRLPGKSVPYWSPIVFLVRKGNPRGIHDWDDLVRPGIKVISANPRTSGGARWAFLAAWGYGQRQTGTPAGGRLFLRRLVAHLPLLDSGARGATTSFAERGIGDVLVTWENEALLAIKELGAERFEIVVPSVSIKAEPPVAMVDAVVDERGTRGVARAYLAFLFTPAAQDIIAANGYRPRDPKVLARYAARFPSLELFDIDRNFGGWAKAQRIFFADGGEFDRAFAAAPPAE